jgi:phage terminase large subunit-like protein
MEIVLKQWVRNKSDEVAIQEGCYFSKEKADHICDFFEKFLCVTTGRLSGQPLKLIPWQRDFLSRLNGWRNKDGDRRFNRVFLGISKKNGKTWVDSGLALYFGLADDESQPEIVMAASSREQATICFRESKNMVMSSTAIKKMCNVVDSRKRIDLPSASGYITVISSDAKRSEGVNASLIICDETHIWRGTELYDALKYAGIARKNSLLIETTTAGSDKESFCFANWNYSKQVISGDVIDTGLLPIIYSADGMDLDDPKTWHAANPSLGYVLSEEEFKASMEQAKESPIKWQSFCRYRFGLWVDSDKAWLNMDRWRECPNDIDKEELKGQVCFGGLDLSHVKDLSTFVLWFPLQQALLVWAWTPRAQVHHRTQKNKASYLRFIELGELTVIDGEKIDNVFIEDKIKELKSIYKIQSVAFDPWGAAQIALNLENEGVDMASFRQGYGSLSEPTKNFDGLVLDKKLRHFNNELLTWCASNCTIAEDSAGNIKPDKEKSHEMIDPIVASIMAIGLAGVSKVKGASVYEERGLLVF